MQWQVDANRPNHICTTSGVILFARGAMAKVGARKASWKKPNKPV